MCIPHRQTHSSGFLFIFAFFQSATIHYNTMDGMAWNTIIATTTTTTKILIACKGANVFITKRRTLIDSGWFLFIGWLFGRLTVNWNNSRAIMCRTCYESNWWKNIVQSNWSYQLVKFLEREREYLLSIAILCDEKRRSAIRNQQMDKFAMCDRFADNFSPNYSRTISNALDWVCNDFTWFNVIFECFFFLLLSYR